ncbi:MAG: type 1 glutamine amidotransferase domain-containing protein [Balneolia bacterium]|nr:type 1 glutamine amidotransferase domain-containing protein [Balneolia bacterium]
MKDRILFVISSHEKLGDTGKKTGYYLSEVAHPWKVLTEAGYEIDFVSPHGGKSPVDGFDLEDPVNKEFWENAEYRSKIDNSMKPFEVDPEDYIAIHYAGGHGTVWDFPNNEAIAELGAKIYENGGVVVAVCHGPTGLMNLKLSDGSYLIDGKKVNAFTNEEERAMELDNVVPFLLEDEMKKRGADFQKADMWQEFTVTDGRLITGQNPQSGTKIGKELVNVLESIRETA